MSRIVAFIMNNILTESMIKKIVGISGDYLVKSTKNSLDDRLWEKVKKNLGV